MVSKDILTRMIHIEPDIHIQIYLALVYTVLIQLFVIRPIKAIAKVVSEGKPWKKATLQLEKESLQKIIKTEVTGEIPNIFWCDKWAFSAQHFLGGCLCLPGFLGLVDPYWGLILSKHGAFCELGYEIGDFIYLIYTRLFDKDGK